MSNTPPLAARTAPPPGTGIAVDGNVCLIENSRLRNRGGSDVTTRVPVDAEQARLAALRRYRILDTPREEPFDRLVRLAARVLGTPIAAVSLVDADRVWFKSILGLDATQVPRHVAMCSRAVAGEAPVLEFPDALADPSLAGNPLLEPPIGVRFYAGAALVAPAGERIGTLCVIDREARRGLTDEQRATLVDLAWMVMTELERRREQMLRESAAARLGLINDILAEVGGAAGFVPAIEAAMRLLCAHTGAAFAHLWQRIDGAPVRRVASAADPGLPAAVVEAAFADRPANVPEAMFGPLFDGEAQVLAPQVAEASVADRPLLLDGYRQGMRAYLFQKLPVGHARYALLLKFLSARDDLPEIAALVNEVGQAIRPTLLRKQDMDRLALLQAAIDATGDAVVVTDAPPGGCESRRVILVNPAFTRMTGFAAEEVLGRSLLILQGRDTDSSTMQRISEAIEARRPVRQELLNYRRDGTPFWVEADIAPFADEDGEIANWVSILRDVTERRATQAAVRHGEKLRVLGELTGGIAHEFANLLTIVQVNLDIALDETASLVDARPELETARRAASAGTELTARLLSFARAETLRSEPTELGAWLGPLREMATRTLGQRYPMSLRTEPGLPQVSVDRSQLEGAVLNLILNARDAMPTGGAIAIATERMEVPPGAGGAFADIAPGSYAVIAVGDHGAGMPAEVAERAFEPFFTTKPAGSGTGLGLSMVLAFARQSGGTALLDTAPGRGTVVRIVLPIR